MRIKLEFLTVLFLSFFYSAASAQTIEKITLKNGSVFEGYLAEQKPGTSLTIHSTSAVVFASEDSLKSVKQQQVELSTLPQVWTDWAIKNGLAEEGKSGQTITLSTLYFKKMTFENVFVQERGVTIRFVDLNVRNYTYPWNTISMTSKLLRPKNQYSGIVDELVMNNGNRYSGQVTDQTPGKGIKIIFDDGQVQSFNYSDIKEIVSKPLNDKLTPWQQSQLIDEVVLKKTEEVIQGLITSRRIGKDYTFLLRSGQTRNIKATDVAVLRKLKNEEYLSAIDKEMKEGEILINGKAENAYFFNLESTETCVILDTESASMQLACGDTIIAEANLPNQNAAITVAKAQVREIEVKRAKGKPVTEPKYVVTLMDLLRSKEMGTREITPLGHIKYTMPIAESGDYVLQIQGIDGYIVIYVPQD